MTPAADALGALSGVTCASATNCIAVGNYAGGLDPLIEQKIGNAWMPVPRLNISSSEPYSLKLNGAACAGGDHCLIVGAQFIGSPTVSKTIIVENTGSVWAPVSSPNINRGPLV